ncbi:MAG: CPBP family intramembrane metalloprotease [Bacilli bacterium]|nr:CPBP family intramembrane metalloprotease [Bacilli bacterium]
MKNKLIDIFKFLVVILLFFNIGKTFSIIFNKLNINVDTFNFIDIAYSEALISLVLFIILFFIYKKTLLDDLFEFKINIKNNLKNCFKLFVILLIVKIIATFIIYILSFVLKINILVSENQSIINLLLSSAPIIMLISTVLLTPFVEEIIFRLGLKKIIKNSGLFILLSGLIFGFMHVFPTDINITVALIQSISYVFIGTLIAYYYVKYKNIYFVIIIHSLNNLLGVLATLLLI